MTTAAQLFTRALEPMRDSAQNFFEDPELLAYLNDAIRDLASRQRIEESSANVTVTAGVAAIPDGVLRIRWLLNPDGNEAIWVDESTWQLYSQDDYDDSDHPLVTAYNDQIHIVPASSGTWTWGYYGLPADLTADTDTVPLPRQWEKKLVHYLKAQMYGHLGEFDAAAWELQQYEQGLRSASAIVHSNDPGRLSFAREPNAFDRDSESIHRG